MERELESRIAVLVGLFEPAMILIMGAVVSGYLWAYLQDIALLPGEYFRQLAQSLNGLDFVLLIAKTLCFGSIIAIVTCYHGLAQPLRLEEVSQATVRAVGQSILLCIVAELGFILLYLAL